jgi:histidinol dehydrogenase
VAGVGEIVLVTPPGADGRANPLVLALAGELGVPRVLCAAGVAALAALALGTESIPPVDKIVGPGNAFIVEAKRQLFGRVGIDSVPGPSEVLIVADGTARADWLAADMLAQAEHDPGSAVLVTTSVRLARDVVVAIGRQLPTLQRRAAIEKGLAEYSAIIVVSGLRAAADLANHFAPEHLQIIAADQQSVLERIRHAGAIFLGPWTPVPLGDYYAGPSHVLPTGGTARFFSALSANDFLKATSVLCYGRRALQADAPDVAEFARREGFSAHARAVEMRTEPIATETEDFS